MEWSDKDKEYELEGCEMRRYLLIGCLMLVALGNAAKDYKIVGKCLDNHAEGKVVLIAYNESSRLDTIGKSTISKGQFLMTGSVTKRKVGYLLINDRVKDYIPIILDEGTFQVVLDGNIVLSLIGTPEQDILNQYLETRLAQVQLLEEFRQRPLDERRNDSIRSFYRERDSQIAPVVKEAQHRLLEKYPDRYASAIFFTLDLKEKGLEELTSIYDLLTGPGRDNPSAKKILERIERLSALEKGALAPNFTMKTPEGKSLELYQIPAKVKIIDFWASWCYPCRKENPLLVKLYEKYHAKGLEIIGISLDDDHQKWIDAIKKDGLPWLHVSELKKWKCEAVTLYDVKVVPHTVVIDSDNHVIARNVRGEALEKLIDELMGNL